MLQALPVTDYHPLLTDVLDKVCEYRPWFYDYIWEPKELRREVASAYLSDAIMSGKLWIVLTGAEVVGIVILNEVRAGCDAKVHFVFFDRELRSKRQLCLDLMAKVFADEDLNLHALRVEVPEYAAKLNGWLRKALGMKYESERWLDSLVAAKRASRKHEATLYEGKWQDVYLLSVTKSEFHSHVRPKRQQSPTQHDSPKPGVDRPSPATASEHSERPVELPTASTPVERAPTASR